MTRALAAGAATVLILSLGAGPAASDPAALHGSAYDYLRYSSLHANLGYQGVGKQQLDYGLSGDIVATPPASPFVFSMAGDVYGITKLNTKFPNLGQTPGSTSGGSTPEFGNRTRLPMLQWDFQGAVGLRQSNQPNFYIGLTGGGLGQGRNNVWNTGVNFARYCPSGLIDVQATYLQSNIRGLRAGQGLVTIPFYPTPNLSFSVGTGVMSGSIEAKSLISVPNPTNPTEPPTTETVFERAAFTVAPLEVGWRLKEGNYGFALSYERHIASGHAKSSDLLSVRVSYFLDPKATLQEIDRANPSGFLHSDPLPTWVSDLGRRN